MLTCNFPFSVFYLIPWCVTVLLFLHLGYNGNIRQATNAQPDIQLVHADVCLFQTQRRHLEGIRPTDNSLCDPSMCPSWFMQHVFVTSPSLWLFLCIRTQSATTWACTSVLCVWRTWKGRCGRWTRPSSRGGDPRGSQGRVDGFLFIWDGIRVSVYTSAQKQW